MRPESLHALTFLLAAGLLPLPLGGQQASDKPLQDLLELMHTPVVSASRMSEKLSDAPATVIVLTHADLEARGYTELSQILDDLPGMDVVRSYGANYFKDYWRGYRNDIGEPFLVLVDGVSFNHLWFNTADTPLVTYPITAIERVEVVYGPASAVYGANALMGVINIITRKASNEDGTSVRGRLTAGSFDTRIADLSATHRSGEFAFTVAARSDKGDVDEAAAERYEYTKRRYYSDRALWGNLVDNPDLGGSPESEHQHQALDVRFWWGDTEAGIQRLWISSGYGLAYAADRSQSIGRWVRPENSFYIRQPIEFSERVSSTMLVRYRESGVDEDSYDVESFYGYGAGTSSVETFYEVLDSSLSYTQDFDFKASERLSFNAGLKFEQKTLQKAYLTAQGPDLHPEGSLGDTNHFNVSERGVYLQGRYRFTPGTQLNLGLRSDHNALYGTANTLRGGFVGTFGSWGLKALYGQGYQEPTPRLLFGATSGTGSNAGLRPERSNTSEVSGSYTLPSFSASLAVYRVKNSGKIQLMGGQVVNSGNQEVTGADLGVQWILPVAFARQWKVWAYYSRYFKAEDSLDTPAGTVTTRSGDLADDKVWLGTTLVLDSRFSASLLGRLIGSRRTVASNPVGKVGGFGTVDLALNARNLGIKGLGASLRIANLLDRAYDHPGLRDAGAGTTPGGFDPSGNWVGSGSYYNSLLPQPGRAVEFTVTLDF
ncbi:MAG TPA: TonB-dependent receptor [Holophagaceae bacterium]|nr:TonB-dependent receptor [Holophagaceae bacterium]